VKRGRPGRKLGPSAFWLSNSENPSQTGPRVADLMDFAAVNPSIHPTRNSDIRGKSVVLPNVVAKAARCGSQLCIAASETMSICAATAILVYQDHS
jgi:hypothetical protein